MTTPRFLPLRLPTTSAVGLSLALGVTSALAFPGLAFADQPTTPSASPQLPASNTAAQPPSGTAQPPSGGAQPPSAEQPTAPKPLPASVLAMQGRYVVIRLDEGPAAVGQLLSVSNDVFVVKDTTGAISGIPRAKVRGIRLAEVEPPPPPPAVSDPASDPSSLTIPHKERSIGFGTSFGGGFSGAGGGLNGAFLMPTVDLQFFLPSEYSVDVTVPVLNMALSSALLGGFVFGTDLYFNVNGGKGKRRFIGGPGIGIAYAKIGYQEVTALKIPFQLGFELLSSTRTFGFKMAARPWIEVPVGGRSDPGVGGGILAVIGFSGYALSDKYAESE